MPQYKSGVITAETPYPLEDGAGELTAKKMARLTKPPRGLGGACDDTADAIASVGTTLTLPPEITPEALRKLGEVAEAHDRWIIAAETLLEKMKQSNLLADHKAYEMLRKVNDAVKSQGKFNKNLLTAFEALNRYMTRKPVKPAESSETDESETTDNG